MKIEQEKFGVSFKFFILIWLLAVGCMILLFTSYLTNSPVYAKMVLDFVPNVI